MSTACVIYVRQSLDRTGEGLAVERQEADDRALAERRGWTVTEVIRDNDVSAAGRKKRPGFDRLIQLIEQGAAMVVVCWDLTRLTRNARDTLRLMEAGEAASITLALVRGSDIDLATPAGRLTATVLAGVARHEIDVKADRQRAAAFQRSQMGRPPLGVRLTGYAVDGKPIEHEAVVVAKLFEDFAAGDSLRSLAARLTKAGVPTRHGGRWSPSTVRTMLLNPRYAGRAIYQGEVTGKPGHWPPLVDEDVFDTVVARLGDVRRKTNRYGHDRKHLGAGLYECGVCGRKVYAWSANRYRCPNACVNRAQSGVDDLVLKMVRGRLSRRDIADLIPARDADQARQLAVEVRRLRHRLSRIGEDYDNELIDGRRYAVASEKARAELAAAEEAYARLDVTGGGAAILGAADPVAAFDGAPLMIRRSVISALCVVKLDPAPRGRIAFDPHSLGKSRWVGDDLTWGQRWDGIEAA